MFLALVFVSAFVFADLMALLCFFCGSVIALWLGGSRRLCFCVLCMHSFIFIEHAKLGSWYAKCICLWKGTCVCN